MRRSARREKHVGKGNKWKNKLQKRLLKIKLKNEKSVRKSHMPRPLLQKKPTFKPALKKVQK